MKFFYNLYNLYNISILLTCAFFFSCASVDVEKSVMDYGRGKQGPDMPAVITVPVDADFSHQPPAPPAEIIVKEKPMYVPVYEEPPKPEIKTTGVDAVKESNEQGILKPGEYSKGAMVYDYDPDWVYEVYTQPLRLTDITLQGGETLSDKPFLSDSDAWMLGASVSQETEKTVQHIYVRPTKPGLDASLIINTSRRSYRIVLRSYGIKDAYMPIVRWRYPPDPDTTVLPGSFARSDGTSGPELSTGSRGQYPDAGPTLDPRYLSFNYKITYSRLKKPSWLPTLVYDDGKKTYIQFPDDVFHSSLPAVFENRDSIVNYRVVDNLLIIDKRIEKITVKIDDIKIDIQKKKGR
jgi:type IV secretion system protein VirB9